MAKNRNLSEDNILDFLNTENIVASETHPDDPISKSQIQVTLDQLRPYDNNPRQTKNPLFDEILEAIENVGMDHPPNITRRNPNDDCYIIMDGGNTRLEILNILYKKYLKLAENTQNDEERFKYTTKADSFYRFKCIFKPWVCESRALIGHISENENHGRQFFIDRALAIPKLRNFFYKEDKAATKEQGKEFDEKPLSARKLAARITKGGWKVSPPHMTRYEYAVKFLLDVIPTALWAGTGMRIIIEIRKYNTTYTDYWQTTEPGQSNPERIQSLFMDTLHQYDDETIDFKGFTRDLNDQLSEILNISPYTVAAEIESLLAGGKPDEVLSDSSTPGATPESDDDLLKTYEKNAPEAIKQGTTLPSVEQPPSPVNSIAGATSGKSQTRQQRPAASKKAQALTPEKYDQNVFEIAQSIGKAHGLEVQLVPADSGERKAKLKTGCPIQSFGVPPTQKPFEKSNKDSAAVWWALFKLSRLYKTIPSLNGKEMYGKLFSQMYGLYETELTTIGAVLFLEDHLSDVNLETQQQLEELRLLIGSSYQTNKNMNQQGESKDDKS